MFSFQKHNRFQRLGSCQMTKSMLWDKNFSMSSKNNILAISSSQGSKGLDFYKNLFFY